MNLSDNSIFGEAVDEKARLQDHTCTTDEQGGTGEKLQYRNI